MLIFHPVAFNHSYCPVSYSAQICKTPFGMADGWHFFNQSVFQMWYSPQEAFWNRRGLWQPAQHYGVMTKELFWRMRDISSDRAIDDTYPSLLWEIWWFQMGRGMSVGLWVSHWEGQVLPSLGALLHISREDQQWRPWGLHLQTSPFPCL